MICTAADYAKDPGLNPTRSKIFSQILFKSALVKVNNTKL